MDRRGPLKKKGKTQSCLLKGRPQRPEKNLSPAGLIQNKNFCVGGLVRLLSPKGSYWEGCKMEETPFKSLGGARKKKFFGTNKSFRHPVRGVWRGIRLEKPRIGLARTFMLAAEGRERTLGEDRYNCRRS